jgi:hypothetical protein
MTSKRAAMIQFGVHAIFVVFSFFGFALLFLALPKIFSWLVVFLGLDVPDDRISSFHKQLFEVQLMIVPLFVAYIFGELGSFLRQLVDIVKKKTDFDVILEDLAAIKTIIGGATGMVAYLVLDNQTLLKIFYSGILPANLELSMSAVALTALALGAFATEAFSSLNKKLNNVSTSSKPDN